MANEYLDFPIFVSGLEIQQQLFRLAEEATIYSLERFASFGGSYSDDFVIPFDSDLIKNNSRRIDSLCTI